MHFLIFARIIMAAAVPCFFIPLRRSCRSHWFLNDSHVLVGKDPSQLNMDVFITKSAFIANVNSLKQFHVCFSRCLEDSTVVLLFDDSSLDT